MALVHASPEVKSVTHRYHHNVQQSGRGSGQLADAASTLLTGGCTATGRHRHRANCGLASAAASGVAVGARSEGASGQADSCPGQLGRMGQAGRGAGGPGGPCARRGCEHSRLPGGPEAAAGAPAVPAHRPVGRLKGCNPHTQKHHVHCQQNGKGPSKLAKVNWGLQDSLLAATGSVTCKAADGGSCFMEPVVPGPCFWI